MEWYTIAFLGRIQKEQVYEEVDLVKEEAKCRLGERKRN